MSRNEPSSGLKTSIGHFYTKYRLHSSRRPFTFDRKSKINQFVLVQKWSIFIKMAPNQYISDKNVRFPSKMALFQFALLQKWSISFKKLVNHTVSYRDSNSYQLFLTENGHFYPKIICLN